MLPTLAELGIDQFSLEDRLNLAEAIWDSVAADLERSPLSDAQQRELERRLADSIARPDAVTAWEVVKQEALMKARR